MPLNLKQYEAVLLDLDGTVYHEDDALPGAIELIRQLQSIGKPYACLTNSTTGPQQLASRLKRMGVIVDPYHIYTAAAATADYVAEYCRPAPGQLARVYNISTEGVEEMLQGRAHSVQREDGPCDAVITGCPVNFFATEERQRTALTLLRRGAKLVSICADRVYPSPRGIEFGAGAFSAMFAYGANVQATFCGKPEKIFFTELCRRLNVNPAKCVLVGDNLESDIAGGAGVGMNTLLTLTGIATREDASRAKHQPSGIINSLSDLL